MYEDTNQRHLDECRTPLTLKTILFVRSLSKTWLAINNRVASGWWLYIYILWASHPCKLLTAVPVYYLPAQLGARLQFANTERCAQTLSVGWNSRCLHLLSATVLLSLQTPVPPSFIHHLAKKKPPMPKFSSCNFFFPPLPFTSGSDKGTKWERLTRIQFNFLSSLLLLMPSP